MPYAGLIFDDGLHSNRAALDVLLQEGHEGADFAVEVEKVGGLYNGIDALPMMDEFDLRYIVEQGGQICNHPAFGLASTEEDFVAQAEAEHAQLRSYLQDPDCPIDMAVLRGGVGLTYNHVVEAYRYLYDTVRTIPGPIADRGDADYFTLPQGRWLRHKCGYNIDTGGSEAKLQQAIALLESASSTGATLILYAHDTPDAFEASDPSMPWLPLDHLRQIARAAYRAGVIFAPMRKLGRSNLCLDPRFAYEASHSFTHHSADGANWSTEHTLHASPRSARLEWTAHRGNMASTALIVAPFVCRPHTRYHITYRYWIEQDLDVIHPNNRNHGLATLLTTIQGNTAGTHVAFANDWVAHRSDPHWRRPYQSTQGQWATHTCTLTTGPGLMGVLKIGGLNCQGVAHIGHVCIERGDSLAFRPQ